VSGGQRSALDYKKVQSPILIILELGEKHIIRRIVVLLILLLSILIVYLRLRFLIMTKRLLAITTPKIQAKRSLVLGVLPRIIYTIRCCRIALSLSGNQN